MNSEIKVTEEELAFYRKHPELVHAFGDRATIHRYVLIAVFVAGFLSRQRGTECKRKTPV